MRQNSAILHFLSTLSLRFSRYSKSRLDHNTFPILSLTFFGLTLVYLVSIVLAMVFFGYSNKAAAQTIVQIKAQIKAPSAAQTTNMTATHNLENSNKSIIAKKNHKDEKDPLNFNQDESYTKAPLSKAESDEHRKLLYALLVGELAVSRHVPGTALSYYLEAARISQDPAIAQQATQYAVQFQAPLPALMAAEMWAQFAPTDLQAQMVATTLLIGQSVERSIPYLTQALIIGPEEVNQNIINIQSRLSENSANNLRKALATIAKNRPQDADAQVAAALSSATLGDIENANTFVDTALKLKPDSTQAIELKAKLIRHVDTTDKKALDYLASNVDQFPKNSELRMFYASALLDSNQLNEAKTHLKKLTDDKTWGGKALIYLAEISTQEEDLKDAHEMLKKALAYPDNKNNAQYLLGELAERQGNSKEAIRWYSEVNPGPYHVPATLRAALLLKNQKEYTKAIAKLHESSPTTIEEQKLLILFEVDILSTSKKLDDAYDLINQVLAKLPTDPDVLLAHSLVAIELKRWDAAENNLQAILAKDPRNSAALNALGYTLSLQKDKQKDARKYMLQALEIAPNNAAYLDTLGWFDYRLGNYKDALINLKKAHELSKDPEIAAHLGELLFMMGQRDEAMVLLKQALDKNPDHDLLNETISRLKSDLKPSMKMVNQGFKS
jgi:tetratricopeptide (TPR) repeat protein